MKALLILPSERPSVLLLSQVQPLAVTPLLGQSLVEYWLSWLAAAGVKEAWILAHDRPETVENLVGDGERWGLNVRVIHESRELTPPEAELKYSPELREPASSAPKDVPTAEQPANQWRTTNPMLRETWASSSAPIAVLDHFPGLADHGLFVSYARHFAALRHWMPLAITPDRVGMRELRPGVWVGSHSHISPEVQLRAPCWVGEHVFVGTRAVLGPEAIIGDGTFIEPEVEIAESCIGPDTLVGSLARVKRSLAWGQTLVDWQSGSATVVPDSFLLCSLRQPRRERTRGWMARLADLYGRNKEEAGLAWKQLLVHKGG